MLLSQRSPDSAFGLSFSSKERYHHNLASVARELAKLKSESRRRLCVPVRDSFTRTQVRLSFNSTQNSKLKTPQHSNLKLAHGDKAAQLVCLLVSRTCTPTFHFGHHRSRVRIGPRRSRCCRHCRSQVEIGIAPVCRYLQCRPTE